MVSPGSVPALYSAVMRAGIIFSKGSNTIVPNVQMTNIVFDNCGSLQNISKSETMNVSLSFKYSSVTLENVTVMNSNGLGFHAYNGNVSIRKCMFLHNSKGHVKINFLYKENVYLVMIIESLFRNGSNANINGSGGLEIYTSNRHKYLSVSLSKCEFSANEGLAGSHVAVKSIRHYILLIAHSSREEAIVTLMEYLCRAKTPEIASLLSSATVCCILPRR